jgi:hypothetical protein
MKANCYKCKFKGDLVWDAHSCCNNPKSAKELKIKGNEYGIRSGWFNFPTNFDPVWLENCNGFEEK